MAAIVLDNSDGKCSAARLFAVGWHLVVEQSGRVEMQSGLLGMGRHEIWTAVDAAAILLFQHGRRLALAADGDMRYSHRRAPALRWSDRLFDFLSQE